MDDGANAELRAIALDDDASLLRGLKRILDSRGIVTTTYTDAREAVAAITGPDVPFDVMLCDVVMPEINGIEVASQVRRAAPDLPVVMLTADDTAQTAVRALKAGAFNYLTKPLQDPDEMVEVLRRAGSYCRLQRRARELERRIDVSERYDRLIGSCDSMRRLFETIDRVAELDVSILLRGESGTGKELVARSIHDGGSRRAGPFVALNCAAIPESLVDSELFGHARGAFTGAIEARAGAFERAHEGTLFLDEVGDVPPAVQVRLLRVLQEGEVTRLGEGTPRPVDVRVIAATWVDLEAGVEAGDFRPDLYYRLNVVSVDLPPLRNRRGDLPLLIAHLTHKHAERMGREPPTFDPAVVDAMCGYRWPGNVRELENVIQRILALSRDDVIRTDALPPHLLSDPVPAGDGGAEDLGWSDGLPLAEARRVAIERFERSYLTRLLRATGGNISEASRRASIDRSNLRRIITRVGLEVGDFKE